MFDCGVLRGRWGTVGSHVAVLVACLAHPTPSPAQITTSDQPAAIVLLPLIRLDSAHGLDTALRITNTTDEPVGVRCFIVDEERRCAGAGSACLEDSECAGGSCAPGVTEFVVRLTPFQPLGWLFSEGLAELALDGVLRVGPDGSSNAGSHIPEAPRDPFLGWMECIVVDPALAPADTNAIKAEAVLYEHTAENVDAADYGAIGIQAVVGASDGDDDVVVGAEYSGCPRVVTFEHFFDGAVEPSSAASSVRTLLALAPCSADFLGRDFDETDIEYVVFTEFGQRFLLRGTSAGAFASPLSGIAAQAGESSPFLVGIAGSLTGKTQVRSTPGGVVGVIVEEHADRVDPSRRKRVAFHLHAAGNRARPDRIVLP